MFLLEALVPEDLLKRQLRADRQPDDSATRFVWCNICTTHNVSCVYRMHTGPYTGRRPAPFSVSQRLFCDATRPAPPQHRCVPCTAQAAESRQDHEAKGAAVLAEGQRLEHAHDYLYPWS